MPERSLTVLLNLTETRKTYRAVLSAPKVVIPELIEPPQAAPSIQQTNDGEKSGDSANLPQTSQSNPTPTSFQSDSVARDPLGNKKRPCDEVDLEIPTNASVAAQIGEVANTEGESSRKKKKKRGNREKAGAI